MDAQKIILYQNCIKMSNIIHCAPSPPRKSEWIRGKEGYICNTKCQSFDVISISEKDSNSIKCKFEYDQKSFWEYLNEQVHKMLSVTLFNFLHIIKRIPQFLIKTKLFLKRERRREIYIDRVWLEYLIIKTSSK